MGLVHPILLYFKLFHTSSFCEETGFQETVRLVLFTSYFGNCGLLYEKEIFSRACKEKLSRAAKFQKIKCASDPNLIPDLQRVFNKFDEAQSGSLLYLFPPTYFFHNKIKLCVDAFY